MLLTLEVVGGKAAKMGWRARKIFQGSGTIGRLDDNDWVLPDEYISGHHAKILYANGEFQIVDTSTNGVFVNSPQNRLTRGQPYTLRQGDTVYIDDYEVRVTLSAEAAQTPARIPENPFGSDGGLGASLSEPTETDPLKLLGIQDARAIPPGPSAAELAAQSPMRHALPPQAVTPATPRPPQSPGVASPPFAPVAPVSPGAPGAQRPPQASPGPAKLIPSDYNPLADFAPGSGSPPASSGVSPFAPPPTTRAPPPRQPAFAPPVSLPADPERVVRPAVRPPPEAPKAAPPIRPAPSRPTPPPPRPQAPLPPQVNPGIEATGERARLDRAAVDRAPTPGPGAAPPAVGANLDLGAMLAAAGIDSARVTPELAQQFGQILKVVVAGLMDVLRARERIKDEFRMRMTTFKPADNNPLKFSANVEDALHNLLVKRNAAYLGPVEAFEDAFQDVRNHQMAMLAGVRVAYQAMLAEFEPARLQEKFDRQGKPGTFLSGSAKAKYWDQYTNKFHDMVKDADTSFRHLFGDEFAKAYEEQLARLKTVSRAERR
jgi:type VI secretion system FHA domain protein